MQTTRFDVTDHLSTHEEQVAYLEAAFEDGDPSLVAAAIGDIARARGASEFARASGLSRETIYKTLVPGGNPTLDTVAKAAKALGVRLSLTRAD